jgi:hypothetical protein
VQVQNRYRSGAAVSCIQNTRFSKEQAHPLEMAS